MALSYFSYHHSGCYHKDNNSREQNMEAAFSRMTFCTEFTETPCLKI